MHASKRRGSRPRQETGSEASWRIGRPASSSMISRRPSHRWQILAGRKDRHSRSFSSFSLTQALQALQNPNRKSGQQIVYKIIEQVKCLENQQIGLNLLWVPAHGGVSGNEVADKLAKEAVDTVESHAFRRLLSTQKREHRENMMREWRQELQTSNHGKHLKRIDEGLPSRHILRLRGEMTRHQTYLFTQLRTGHAWLKDGAKLRKLSKDDECECGAKETVVHVLVDCPRLIELRKELRTRIGDSFNSVARMLGGCQKTRQGKLTQWPIDRTVVYAVLEFAEKSGRFYSRTPRTSRTPTESNQQ